MSLDIYFYKKERKECPHCGQMHDGKEVLHEQNITHNLGKMASALAIYHILWQPEDMGTMCAFELIVPLATAITKMKVDPEKYKAFDSPNGWGTYDTFLPWLERLLDAAMRYDDALIEVSR